MNYKRVAQLRTPEQFLDYCQSVDAEMPFDADVQHGADAPLAQPYSYRGTTLSNRFSVLPMEGWDGTADGHPSDLTKRRWQRDGQTMHHLIDPRTGQPAQTDALSVSVIADRTVMAEVYAKAALVLGVEQGLNFLQHLPGIEGFIFAADSTIVQTDGFHYYISKRIGETYDNHDFQTQTQ